MTPELFIQHFFNALAFGALYGLIAIGYTMVYGILRLINFAHGDIFMIGAYLVFFSTIEFMPLWVAVLLLFVATGVVYYTFIGKKASRWRTPFFICQGLLFCLLAYTAFVAPIPFAPPWLIAVLFAIVITSVCGIVIDRVAYLPLRNAPRISALISAIGISFLIENLCVVIFSGLPRAVVQPDFLATQIRLKLEFLTGNPDSVALVSPIAFIVPAVSILLVSGLLWILYKTKPGLAMRAISKDMETTRLMGVSINKVIALTFALGSALAAASGIMWALRYPQIQPYMGVIPGFKAFIAAVLGGIGSIQGALVGGLLLGFIEVMIIAFKPNLAGYRDAIAFVLLIVILLFRPTGLLGEKLEEKI